MEKNIFGWYAYTFTNYVTFSGRARRKEYWFFFLLNFVAIVALSVVPVLGFIFSIAIVLPSLAVGARRLHDIGRTGWWLLLYFVPFIGGIVLLILHCLNGQAGDNQYGPDPKAPPVVDLPPNA